MRFGLPEPSGIVCTTSKVAVSMTEIDADLVFVMYSMAAGAGRGRARTARMAGPSSSVQPSRPERRGGRGVFIPSILPPSGRKLRLASWLGTAEAPNQAFPGDGPGQLDRAAVLGARHMARGVAGEGHL